MSAVNHPRGGVETRVRREPGLQGVNAGNCLIGDFGKRHRNELYLCADEATFWKEYAPTLVVQGQTIGLGPKCRPEPLPIARLLLEQPGSANRILRDFAVWLRQVATPREILAVLNELQRTPAA